MDTGLVQGITAAAAPTAQTATPQLKSEDYFQLLIAQLTNQDPLEPMSNEQLVSQMSAISEIELNSELTESLKALAGQQQFGSASSLIGQFVSGLAGESGQLVQGMVSAIRFLPGGQIMLDLDSGHSLSLNDLNAVTSPRQAADALMGRFVSGFDRREALATQLVEGVVTGVREQDGDLLLDLDTGEEIRFSDVRAVEMLGTGDGQATVAG
jgi:flagellar hook assembly protein FlgD